MLRITTEINEHSARLILEGRLIGSWVSELSRCWDTFRAGRSADSIRIDMKSMTFADDEGIQLLTELYRCGAELVASGCFMESVVKDIKRAETAVGDRAQTGRERGKSCHGL